MSSRVFVCISFGSRWNVVMGVMTIGGFEIGAHVYQPGFSFVFIIRAALERQFSGH